MTDKQLGLLLRIYKYKLDEAYTEMFEKMPPELLEKDETGFYKAVKFTRPIVDFVESLKIDIEDLGVDVFD